MKLATAVAAGAALVAACARPQAQSADQTSPPCEPVDYAIAPGLQASDLTGKYRITLVATTGDSAGRRAEGGLALELSGRPDAALIGRTTVPVERVDAFRVGQLEVSGDSAPGVLLFLSPGERPGALLRLGSDANARGGAQAIEGMFTALTVLRVDSAGFAGSWRSGAMTDRAAGYFCATRVSP